MARDACMDNDVIFQGIGIGLHSPNDGNARPMIYLIGNFTQTLG